MSICAVVGLVCGVGGQRWLSVPGLVLAVLGGVGAYRHNARLDRMLEESRQRYQMRQAAEQTETNR